MTTENAMSGRALPPSLWAATAIDAPHTPALTESTRADVLVIGAGFTGLSTALHLAEQGASVRVVDSHQPGWGASGRNGGQVNPTLKYDPDELVKKLGAARAEPLIEAISGSADLVFDLIARHGIDCQPVRAGWLQLGYTQKAVDGMHARARQWARRGVNVEMLDRDAVARRVGTDAFAGGWLDGRAGAIQPLSYTRGLAGAAQRAGASIHGDSAVVSLTRAASQGKARWQATLATGATVEAEHVVIATNGYTGPLWPGLSSTMLTANSFIVATRRLTSAAADAILERGETASTSQRLLLYFRKDNEGRLLMGGRGFFADPRGPEDFAHLERSLELLFPQLGPLDYAYRWSGRIAVTRDFMPHVHEPAPGVTVAVGCNGRGIALCTSFGKHIAERLVGAGMGAGRGAGDAFPYPISPIVPIPMHGLQRFYVAAGVAWYSLLDRFG